MASVFGARNYDLGYMGGCQNYDPLLGPLNTRCCSILRTQNWMIILKTTHTLHTWVPGPSGNGPE